MKEYRVRRRQEIYNSLGGVCVQCNSNIGIEIDHMDPSLKEFSIASKWTASKETLVKELKKCQLLCNSCHKIKTKAERQISDIKHGTLWGYIGRGCRCDECRKAKSINFKKNYHMSLTG